ncbi:hypothetical protein cyc_03493 [Cyclospora cayetanensis]|uniref:J domain-containing protein n=1 Tax=Cyclospora cayetanensis TaxID=88456 RepID=A0A1D3CXP5_9EIME|nr:hypothetical protein cyc_03493 [Cyclospora cayetanensis]
MAALEERRLVAVATAKQRDSRFGYSAAEAAAALKEDQLLQEQQQQELTHALAELLDECLQRKAADADAPPRKEMRRTASSRLPPNGPVLNLLQLAAVEIQQRQGDCSGYRAAAASEAEVFSSTGEWQALMDQRVAAFCQLLAFCRRSAAAAAVGSEDEILWKQCSKQLLLLRQWSRFFAAAHRAIGHPFYLIGVNPHTATEAVVAAARKKWRALLHPDKFHHSQEVSLQQQATEAFKAVRAHNKNEGLKPQQFGAAVGNSEN